MLEIKQNDFTFEGWKYNTMPVIKNAGDKNTDVNKGYYIDLPIEMPFTANLLLIFEKSLTSFAALVGSSKEKANIVGPTNKSLKQEYLVSVRALFASVFLIIFR